MAQLFISLYLDEDVDILLAELVRARGFDILTTQEAGQIGQKDPEQIAFAVSQERTFLTHNRVDFERIYGEFEPGGYRKHL